MVEASLHTKRSFTGHHTLAPAAKDHTRNLFVPIVPTRAFISWTFGRGTVIWRLWPAVLLHTVFAAVVVSISLKTNFQMNVPPILVTVLGVVIGFVISYRASSGYDRYWMGRTSWSDVVRNARGISRIIWFHVPPRVSPRTPDEIAEGVTKRSKEEMLKIMNEKRMALDLVEGFVVALKHHLRGEMGVYYEDLYHLVRPLHDHWRPEVDTKSQAEHDHPLASAVQETSHLSSPQSNGHHTRSSEPSSSTPTLKSSNLLPVPTANPIVPAINAYGTFDQTQTTKRKASANSFVSSSSDGNSENRPLLPSELGDSSGLLDGVSRDLIPFQGIFSAIHTAFRWKKVEKEEGLPTKGDTVTRAIAELKKSHNGPNNKHRPKVAGGGQNLPLAILRCLSEWVSVIDDRMTMNGNANGGLYTYISNFEDNLSALERILTTPLPFVYSVHISTVWIYLFLLPFQLIDQCGWSTIPVVGIASFIYLGFLAAGEEIEQPFGYDENDLDLDVFCQEIVHKDIDCLKGIPCLNAYLTHQDNAPGHRSIVETSMKGNKVAEQEVFGTL